MLSSTANDLRQEILGTKGTRSHDVLTSKNKATGQTERIEQFAISLSNDPNLLSFYVLDEMSAYKAAYQYQYSGVVSVDFRATVGLWLVIVSKT